MRGRKLIHVKDLRRRVRFLEKELKNVRTEQEPAFVKRSPFLRKLQEFNRFLNGYQFLISLITGVLVVGYIQLVYGINPFESYENTSTTKSLTGVYQEMGDDLILRGKNEEAERAYKSALGLQPNNAKAILGLAKVEIFNPIEGQKYTDREAVDRKLDFLIKKFPSDSDLYFLKAENADDRFDFETKKNLLVQSIGLNEGNASAHSQLGYICLKEEDLACAYEQFKRAVDLDPDSSVHNLNFGHCELLRLRFEEATRYLEKAGNIHYDSVTAVTLGEVYKFSGKFSDAESEYRDALDFLEEDVSDNEGTVRGKWLFNYMPRDENDELVKISATFSSRDEKKMLVYFLSAVNYALTEDLKSATNAFDKATKLNDKNDKDTQQINKLFFISNCLSAAKTLKPNFKVKNWLNKYSRKVAAEAEYAKLVDSFFKAL